jgi:hypothetical protein
MGGGGRALLLSHNRLRDRRVPIEIVKCVTRVMLISRENN